MIPDEFDKFIRELYEYRRVDNIKVSGKLPCDYFIDDIGKTLYISNFTFQQMNVFYANHIGNNSETSRISSIYGIPLRGDYATR